MRGVAHSCSRYRFSLDFSCSCSPNNPLITDRPSLPEAVSLLRSQWSKGGSGDDGILQSFIHKILDSLEDNNVVPIEVDFYRRHKKVVDAKARVPVFVGSSALQLLPTD